ncbi:MAG TPA: hypothetical protein VJ697_01725 [Nitrososphaeraceae archaeon]|nr:hypothetical protein [Nitrososphaeraceae archaeon]
MIIKYNIIVIHTTALTQLIGVPNMLKKIPPFDVSVIQIGQNMILNTDHNSIFHLKLIIDI